MSTQKQFKAEGIKLLYSIIENENVFLKVPNDVFLLSKTIRGFNL